jgi:hypothetical protein
VFEKVVLRRSELGNAVTAGQIAEALLFYQNVHLIIDRASLGQLVRQLGAGTLLSLLQRADCTGVFCEETLGTRSEAVGLMQAHDFIAFTLTGHEALGSFRNREDQVAYILQNEGVPNSDARRFAKAFLRYAPSRRLSGDFYISGGITKAARRDLKDGDYVRAAVNAALARSEGVEPLGAALRFDILDSDLGMYVFSNVDFGSVNARRAGLCPPREAITPAHLLSHILEARADLALAAFYGGDFVSSEITSSIVELRYAEILRRGRLNEQQRAHFHQVTLPDYPSLRETIDSGQRSFAEFLLLLDKATRFKEWLRTAAVDEGLLRSYTAALSKEGWIQSVPAKTARYLFTATLEQQNPVLGAVAAIADNFIVEKLLGGWRPNHFVDNRLGPFIRP